MKFTLDTVLVLSIIVFMAAIAMLSVLLTVLAVLGKTVDTSTIAGMAIAFSGAITALAKILATRKRNGDANGNHGKGGGDD